MRSGFALCWGRWQLRLRGFGNVSVNGGIMVAVKLGVLGRWRFWARAFGCNFVARSCARSNMALKADWPDAAQFIV
jgi:hypothetical protein